MQHLEWILTLSHIACGPSLHSVRATLNVELNFQREIKSFGCK